jgi:hypothetical protein
VQTRYVRSRGPDITATRVLAPLSTGGEAVGQIIGASVFDIAPPGPNTGILATDQIDRAQSSIDVL